MNKNSNTALYVVIGILVIILIATNVTGMSVHTVRGDLNDVSAQLTAQAAATATLAPATEAPAATEVAKATEAPKATEALAATEAPAAQSQDNSAAPTYKVDGNTVMVYSGETLIAKIEFTQLVDNNPSEWLKDRPGIGFLYQSGVNNTAKMKITLFEGGSFAMDGDQFVVAGQTLGKKDNPEDVIVFADKAGTYDIEGWSFGASFGPWNGSEDKAGFTLADRRAATGYDNRPEFWLDPTGKPVLVK